MREPSKFTVCLTMVIVMIVGAALVPLLDVGIKPPPRQGMTLTIDFSWPGAAPKVVEHSATSVIEGVVSGVKGVEKVSSQSYMGRGRVRIQLKKSANVSAVRFEIASMLRQIYSKLPDGVTYPSLSGGEIVNSRDRSNRNVTLLTYNINADMPETEMSKYAEKAIAEKVRRMDGVKEADISGATGEYMELSYDPKVLEGYGISSADIAEAIRNFTGREDIIGDVMHDGGSGRRVRQTLYLTSAKVPLGDIPLTTADGHTVYLNNLVRQELRRKVPDKFYRVNGMNTVYLNIKVNSEANFITLSDRIQREVAEIEKGLQDGTYLTLAYDAAAEERVEVFDLISRSLMSLAILLMCVWLTRRDWKYLFIIASTLAANILMAVIAYYLFGLRLHIFSMAGITVSMGLIIDSSIVMADHYGYYHNRKAFLAILAAMLTTIGSLVTVVALPADWQDDLYDFSRIIVINLAVSLLVALLFVPALTDMLRYSSRSRGRLRHARAIVRFDRAYARYISFAQRHRWMWGILLALAFGVPLFALPERLGDKDVEDEALPWHCRWYNATLGSDFFIRNCKEPLQDVLGGSLKLFVDALDEARDRDDDTRPVLTIRGELPQGGTAAELNEKVVMVEDALKREDGIKRFETSINGRGATIKVEFDDSCAFTSLPYAIESRMIGKLISIGGADWSTYGVSRMGFSNSLNLQYRSNRIMVTGYNFDRLSRYAGEIAAYMSSNARVRDVRVEVPEHETEEEELYMDYDRERMAIYDFRPTDVYAALANLLATRDMGVYDGGNGKKDVVLKSAQADRFDSWQLMNSYVRMGDRYVRVDGIADIDRREATGCIPKENQEYVLCVAFNVLGSYSYTHDYVESVKAHFNRLMPMGYKCSDMHYSFRDDKAAPYWVLGIVVAVIFFVCAVLFESLRVPLVIISLIPVSFIGLFITFWLTGVRFGTGGFASMVMLAGVVVNSGIYVINEYRLFMRSPQTAKRGAVRVYVKAYNHKIIPVMLTVFSTVLGLVPFFIDGDKEPFWNSFATGVTGGLLFSVPALVLVLPVMLGKGKPERMHYDCQEV